jgi:predicted small secreted protein
MKTITVLLALTSVLLLTACNTMRGAGEDIQKAGSAIENAAKKK